MAWYDLGGLLLGLLFLGLLLPLVGYVFVLAFGLYRGNADARRKERLAVRVETPFGPFVAVPNEGAWDFVGDGPDLAISANDVDGVPDPAFVARLPGLLSDLDRLDALAREAYGFDEEDGPFALYSLSEGDGEEVVLAYNAEGDEEDGYGTVFVTLLVDEVVRTVLVH